MEQDPIMINRPEIISGYYSRKRRDQQP